MANLLLEIGTEELPFQFIAPGLQALGEAAERLFKEQRLACGAVRTFGTPRRLVLAVEGLATRQEPTVKEVMGPSKAVAFDAAGQPTKAALGFAGSQGLSVAQLEVRQTPKGDYLFAVKRDLGRPTVSVLADTLPGLIQSLSFPKAMRWNATGFRFARPIRWLLALYGGRVVRFQVGGVESGNRTWGHRFWGAGARGGGRGLVVRNLKDYLKRLEAHGVLPDQDRRRAMIVAQLDRLATSAGGQLHQDEELLEQAVYTVEYPHAIVGAFDPAYLSLPKDILMTAMKEHQGYFSLTGRDGRLLPRFLAVTNIKLPDMALIRKGNERVLAARLADAKFYFDEDRKVRLEDRVERLKQIIFHQKLGTLYQKTERLVAVAGLLANQLRLSAEERDACIRAARLCKTDLTTGVVGEFPTLQGIIGREYARHDGEPEAVCRAIGEQYLPRAMEGELPATVPGRVLSLADRLDTIVAFFAVGLSPTGSEDPFALRRHATAVVRILVEGGYRLNLAEPAARIAELLAGQGVRPVAKPGEASEPLSFILERLRYYGRTVHGLRDDVMEAAIRTPHLRGETDLADLLARMKALQAITARSEFGPLMVGFTRAHRLVQKENWTREDINPSLFQHATEGELHRMLVQAQESVSAMLRACRYTDVLEHLVRLKPAIDGFFEGVLVNTDEPEVRANRLSLLCAIDRLFLSFADFSQIAG
ncbi:glycine--tRNA ligase subunit beta [Nitrospira sp. Kam-Ns4a]